MSGHFPVVAMLCKEHIPLPDIVPNCFLIAYKTRLLFNLQLEILVPAMQQWFQQCSSELSNYSPNSVIYNLSACQCFLYSLVMIRLYNTHKFKLLVLLKRLYLETDFLNEPFQFLTDSDILCKLPAWRVSVKWGHIKSGWPVNTVLYITAKKSPQRDDVFFVFFFPVPLRWTLKTCCVSTCITSRFRSLSQTIE